MENIREKQDRDEPLGTPADSELEEAIERVYQKYGSDLREFVRDIQKDLQKRAAQDCTSGKPFLL